MTRALDLTQRQVRALCEGAKKAGYAPIVHIGKVVVTLVPEEHAIPAQDERRIDGGKRDAGNPLQNWREARNAGKAYGRP